MSHVFQVVSRGFSRNSSKFQNLHREMARIFPKYLRLYKEVEPIRMESLEFFQVPGYPYYIRLFAPSLRSSEPQIRHMEWCSKFFQLLQPIWGETQEFLQVPEPIKKRENVYHYNLTGRRLTGSCLERSRNMKKYMEKYSYQRHLYRGEEIGIFPIPTA